jgi:three-Cys-motif partner protein
MGKTKTQATWLSERIRLLCEWGEKHAGSGPTVEYGPHTLLKLICLSYYAEMFAKIAKGEKARAHGYDGALYLDLFAGPGVVTIRGTGDKVAGSPIAAISAANVPFDHSVLIESNPERSSALLKRLGSFLPPDTFTVFKGDCNKELNRVVRFIKEMWERPIILTFVDPEGMEAKWKTIKQLGQDFPNIDFMINLTSGIARVAGRIVAGMEGDKPIFEDFFGGDAGSILVKAAQGQAVASQYELGIKEVLGKPMGATIPIIDESGRLVYDLLGYTRLSWTGSPWASGFETLQNRLSGVDGSLALHTLNIIKGRQLTLPGFLPS